MLFDVCQNKCDQEQNRLGGGYMDRWKEAVTLIHQEHLENDGFVTDVGRDRGDRCLYLLDSAGSDL